jgi:hypothetical protein
MGSLTNMLGPCQGGVCRTRLLQNTPTLEPEGSAPGQIVLPPSSGPTQAGTTPEVRFRAVIGPHGEENVELKVAL